jgi:photosystem II stability/assembly factor-like uncharacterized protein
MRPGLRHFLSAVFAALLSLPHHPVPSRAQTATWERDGLEGRDVRALVLGQQPGNLLALSGGARDPLPLWVKDSRGWTQPSGQIPGFVLAFATLPEGGLLLATGRDISDQPGIFLMGGNPPSARHVYDVQAIGALAVAPARQGSEVYAATAPWADREAASELLRRDPQTGSWTVVHRGSLSCGQATSYFRHLAVANGGRLYALEWCFGDSVQTSQLWRTDDHGQSWSVLPRPSTSGRLIGTLAVDPDDPDVLYVSTFAAQTSSASLVQAGAPEASQLQAMERSEDGGQTWTGLGSGVDGLSAVRAIILDPRNSDRILVGADRGGAFMSDDRGASWRHLGGLEGLKVRSLLLHADSDRLYAGTSDGIWRINVP